MMRRRHTILIFAILFIFMIASSEQLCRDSLDPSRINDNYCDCEEDGSDETLTSAYSYVHVSSSSNKFHCQNKGYIESYIHTSKVNDGICDCCDGSDEPQGKCPSTCYELGKGLREDLQAKIQAIKTGIKIRNTRSEQGKAGIAAKKSELEQKREELKKLEAEKEKADQEKERLEKIEEVERNLLREKKLLEKEEAKAAAEAEKTATEEKKEEKVEEATEQGTTEATPEEGAEEQSPVENVEEKVEEEDEEVKNFKTEEAEKARETSNTLSKEIDDLKKQISQLETIVAIDFGSDYEYYPLYDKCIEMKQRQYTYELCFFNKANQKEHGATLLGNFAGWNDDKTVMKYENGLRCWSGPNRSCSVKVECAGTETNEIVSVDEPSRCVYEMVLKTASACDSSLLPALEQELEKLQQ